MSSFWPEEFLPLVFLRQVGIKFGGDQVDLQIVGAASSDTG
jgi:hypothetical protein